MRKMLFLAFFVCWAIPAAATDVRPEYLARSVSLMRALGVSCGPAHGVNPREADKYFRDFTGAGRESFGKTAFAHALACEYHRRTGEISVTGLRNWCAQQRSELTRENSEFRDSQLFRN